MVTRRSLGLTLMLVTMVQTQSVAISNPDAAALQRRILEHARTVRAEDHSFTRTVRSLRIEGEKKTERVEVERWDPASRAQPWTLMSLDGRAPTAEELAKHARSSPKRRRAHYGRLAEIFATPATVSTDAKGRIVFRFESLPPETLVVANVDISANSICEATVDRSGAVPFVERARFTLAKPQRVKVVAKLEKFEAVSRYRMMADGKPVLVEHVSNARGSLLGKQGRVHSVLTYSDHRPTIR